MSDLISRQAAICAIEEYTDRLQMVNWEKNPGVPYKVYTLNWAINTLRDLPSAERRGRWEDIPFTARWICSNCDYISEFASFKYCPDCGARMDLEDEE